MNGADQSALRVRNLTKAYGDFRAVDDVSFELAPGHIFALLGANGAGKSTTVHMLLGLVDATSGSIEIAGRDVKREPAAIRSMVAYVPDKLALYPHLTGYENLDYFHHAGGGVRHSKHELEHILERVGLDRMAFCRRAATYSKGMCQKVGLAIALAKGAKLLVLDEPLSGLDPKAANEFCAKLREVAQSGTSVLMATHDLFRAHEIAQHIGIMRGGVLVKMLATTDVDAAGLERLYLEQMR